jgi:hypothetical protein
MAPQRECASRVPRRVRYYRTASSRPCDSGRASVSPRLTAASAARSVRSHANGLTFAFNEAARDGTPSMATSTAAEARPPHVRSSTFRSHANAGSLRDVFFWLPRQRIGRAPREAPRAGLANPLAPLSIGRLATRGSGCAARACPSSSSLPPVGIIRATRARSTARSLRSCLAQLGLQTFPFVPSWVAGLCGWLVGCSSCARARSGRRAS